MDGISSVRLDASYANTIQSSYAQHARRPAGLDAAATLLGMSDGDLRTAMQGGQSLADLASSKGVSKDQLVSTIAAAIQQANPSMSSDRATTIATEIATRTPGSTGDTDDASNTKSVTGTHRHHRHHAMATAMSAASEALGMSGSDLSNALKSGQSLSSLATSKGIAQDDLVKAIADALGTADSNLSGDQAKDLATRLVTTTSQPQPWASADSGSASTFGISA